MTCCITGHRDLPPEHLEAVRQGLRREILRAIGEGYTRFLSGFARGSDLLFAQIVLALKQEHPAISLGAILPYEGSQRSQDPLFCRLLAACDSVVVQSPAYTPLCFFDRDRALVEASSLVIAVYDGRATGGTRYTLRYARSLGRTVRIVHWVEEAEQLEMPL